MEQLVEFAKIEAAGNDFILLDQRKIYNRLLSSDQIKHMCDRHFGIGADGIIFLSVSKNLELGMRYFNADGSEGDMCGNGLRAVVLFANILSLVELHQSFEIRASDGMHEVQIDSPDHIKVEILSHGKTRPVQQEKLTLPQDMNSLGFINTGVPHLVVNVESDLEKIDVNKIGSHLRNHLMFASDGTNVNFIKAISDKKIKVRTYERGVDNETLSCGTGVTASALVYWDKFYPSGKSLEIETNGGKLEVLRKGKRIFLKGPAHVVFIGQYLIEKK